jgi:hypothetical protein
MEDAIRELEEEKNKWLGRAFVIGCLGLISILVNIPEPSTLNRGIQIGFLIYLVIIVVCLWRGYICHKRMKELIRYRTSDDTRTI